MALINDFISTVKTNGLARTNRYAVTFSTPAGVDATALRDTILFCDQVQLPGVNYSTTQNRTYGEFREVPYEKIYDNISMSFYVDKDMRVKKLFDQWVSSISNPVTRTYNFYKSYVTNMTIEVQDIQDKTSYTVTLYECYPKSIGSVQLDYASKDVMKLTVNMQYKYWESDTTTTLNDNQVISTNLLSSFRDSFDNFQKKFNSVLPETDTITNGITNLKNDVTAGFSKVSGLLNF